MDKDLRVGLWNCIYLTLFDGLNRRCTFVSESPPHYVLCLALQKDYFKHLVDSVGRMGVDEFHEKVKHYFFSNAEWFEVFDFIEFTYENFDYLGYRSKITEGCNKVLEKELSAYRLVDGLITPITDNSEIASIDEALDSEYEAVRLHLKTALGFLSDRQSPNYRNSVKESISAVESLAERLTGNHPADIDDLMNYLTENMNLHGALKSAFRKFYGWTSDDSGIRHALNEKGETTDFEDAKFMLVACSAFVNYVEGKLARK